MNIKKEAKLVIADAKAGCRKFGGYTDKQWKAICKEVKRLQSTGEDKKIKPSKI